MSIPRLALLLLLAPAACNSHGTLNAVLMATPTEYTFCCDDEEGDYVGPIALGNGRDRTVEIFPVAIAPDLYLTIEDEPGEVPVEVGTRIERRPGTTATFGLYVADCFEGTQTVRLRAVDKETGQTLAEWTVTVREECPEPPEESALLFPPCGTLAAAERLVPSSRAGPHPPETASLAGAAGGIFGPGDELVVSGEGGGACCALDGTTLQTVPATAFHGGRALPEVAGRASPAIFFHGNAIVAFSAWVEANDAFGMISLGGGFDNWTDVAPSGDEATTDHYLLVGNSGSRIRPIVPLDFVPQWGLGSFDIVPPSMFDAAWGKPVTVARLERMGDIVVACEPGPADPGNLVVVSMGGDDTADSAAPVGQTGRQPRVLRGRDGVYGVTCFGENLLSLFRKTATGFEKIGDAVVGDGPLGLDVKGLGDGNVAFLCTGSRDDTWSVVVVSPATGAIVSTKTKPVPEGIREPTDCAWDEGGFVYLLGKATQQIARFDSDVE
jgi:hypothetical protein